MVTMDGEDGGEGEELEGGEGEEEPVPEQLAPDISLNSVIGLSNPKTMKWWEQLMRQKLW